VRLANELFSPFLLENRAVFTFAHIQPSDFIYSLTGYGIQEQALGMVQRIVHVDVKVSRIFAELEPLTGQMVSALREKVASVV
jgi:hypothetical protein